MISRGSRVDLAWISRGSMAHLGLGTVRAAQAAADVPGLAWLGVGVGVGVELGVGVGVGVELGVGVGVGVGHRGPHTNPNPNPHTSP